MKRDITFDLPTGPITFKDIELPDANTPLPPTNAAIHILDVEYGYGTPNRKFVMMCGVSWKSRESTGEHKYVFQDEAMFHKHVNCQRCLEIYNG